MKQTNEIFRRPRSFSLYGDSETDANMLYATRMFVPDPFLYFVVRGKSYIIVSDLEYSRARREASVDCVLSNKDAMQDSPVRDKGVWKPSEMLAHQLMKRKVTRIAVPKTFPVGMADELRERGITVIPIDEPFLPNRAVKSVAEVKDIETVLRVAEHGMKAAMETLKHARVAGKTNTLVLGGRSLTSERMREIIHKAILDKGCTAKHTIVACGPQSYDPHERGNGPLRAHQPIIIDIFPRSDRTGYYGDITRTVVKGTPSEWVRKAYRTVAAAQKIAFESLSHGVQGNTIHDKISAFFEHNGFPTKKVGDKMVGFFHGTGHGLGLALHEFPWIGQKPCTLKKGHVVTVEPGIYYPDVGGVRLEDVVWITEYGAKVLTRFPKFLKV